MCGPPLPLWLHWPSSIGLKGRQAGTKQQVNVRGNHEYQPQPTYYLLKPLPCKIVRTICACAEKCIPYSQKRSPFPRASPLWRFVELSACSQQCSVVVIALLPAQLESTAIPMVVLSSSLPYCGRRGGLGYTYCNAAAAETNWQPTIAIKSM